MFEVHKPSSSEASPREFTKEYYRNTNSGYYPIYENGSAFIGFMHDNDPDSKNIQKLEDDFIKFATAEGEKTVILEGYSTSHFDAQEPVAQAISARGENGLIEKRAHEESIEIKGVEPSAYEEFRRLADEFGVEETLYWYTIRQAAQWAREDAVPRNFPWNKAKRGERHSRVIDTHLDEYIDRLEAAAGHTPSFQEVSLSFQMLNDVHDRYFGGELDFNDTNHFNTYANPFNYPDDKGRVFTEIHRRSNQIRDEALVEGVKSEVRDGKKVFVVYGHSHIWQNEALLKNAASV